MGRRKSVETMQMAKRAASEMIDLQRRLFERQRKIIERSEGKPSRGFKRYRDEYEVATSGYIAESGFGALCDAMASANVAFIADYHTLQLAQRTFVKLIRGILHQVDNICLALEFVHQNYQSDLDRYLKRKIQEKTFLRRIRYAEHWPYDIWPSFKQIFDLAIDRGFPVVAIDSDASFTLRKRDELAAERIADTALKFPDATVLVYTGQMHVAPSHLPRAVDRAYFKRGLDAPERVIVYQNAAEIYWQLAQARREGVEVVQVDSESYCVNNTPPLVQQLSYLHWLQFDQELLEYTELDSTVRMLIRNIGRFLKLPVNEADKRVRVLMPGDLNLVDVLEHSDLTGREIQHVLTQVEAQQSACIPSLNLIYLATLSVNHAAEEAAHYLKSAVSGGKPPRAFKDKLYYRVLNEAAGFFGSKVINPKRKTDHQGSLRRIAAHGRKSQRRTTAEEKAAAFALNHLAWQAGRRTRRTFVTALKDPRVFDAAAHMLGYILGDRLYYGLIGGKVAKSAIRQLFLTPHDGPDEALDLYLDLSLQVRGVKIPRRI